MYPEDQDYIFNYATKYYYNNTVSDLMSFYPNSLASSLDSEILVLEGFYSDNNNKLYGQYYYDEIISHGGKAIMSKKEHESGSDRIAEAVANVDCDIVVNVQGDEPFTERESLEKVLEVFKGDADVIA